MSTTSVTTVTTTNEQHLKIQRQLDLEREMVGLGIVRFRANLQSAQERGEGSTVPAHQRLMKGSIQPLAKAISDFLEADRSGKSGRKHVATAYLRLVDPEVTAFLTIRVTLDEISRRSLVQKAAIAIGSALED